MPPTSTAPEAPSAKLRSPRAGRPPIDATTVTRIKTEYRQIAAALASLGAPDGYAWEGDGSAFTWFGRDPVLSARSGASIHLHRRGGLEPRNDPDTLHIEVRLFWGELREYSRHAIEAMVWAERGARLWGAPRTDFIDDGARYLRTEPPPQYTPGTRFLYAGDAAALESMLRDVVGGALAANALVAPATGEHPPVAGPRPPPGVSDPRPPDRRAIGTVHLPPIRMLPLKIRVGLPSPGGRLVEYARELGCPALVSANSFVRRDPTTLEVKAVRAPSSALAHLDVMLDSGGFVAMTRYNGYDWSPETYVRTIVAAHQWSAWAPPDYCCEPEVAWDPVTVVLRQAESVRLYHECLRLSKQERLPPPMPVLQGWTVDDYLRCSALFGFQDQAPPLIGIGSVCRRHVHGPAGILAVVEALDRVLPVGSGLHLFGVKGAVLAHLLSRPHLVGRIASIDSMAWDAAARRAHPTGRTTAVRTGFMRRWYLRQVLIARRALRDIEPAMALRVSCGEVDWRTGDPALDQWTELVAAGEMEMASASSYYDREAGCRPLSPALLALGREPGRPPPRPGSRAPILPPPADRRTRVANPDLQLSFAA